MQKIYFFAYAILKNFFYKKKISFEEFDSIFSSMEIIANITTINVGISDFVPLFDIIFDMINIIETETTTNEKCNQTIYKQTRLIVLEDNEDESNEMYFGYQCFLIRILANICFQNKKIQDKVREKGLIPIILKKSNIDFENPYIQEWCIMAIRNLTEDNDENQKEISKFKPMDVDPSTQSVMKKMGMGIKVEEGNKVSITKL